MTSKTFILLYVEKKGCEFQEFLKISLKSLDSYIQMPDTWYPIIIKTDFNGQISLCVEFKMSISEKN